MGQDWVQVVGTTGTELLREVWSPSVGSKVRRQLSVRTQSRTKVPLSPSSRLFPWQCFLWDTLSKVQELPPQPTEKCLIFLPQKSLTFVCTCRKRQKCTTEMEWATFWASIEKQEKDKGSTSYPRKGLTHFWLPSDWGLCLRQVRAEQLPGIIAQGFSDSLHCFYDFNQVGKK